MLRKLLQSQFFIGLLMLSQIDVTKATAANLFLNFEVLQPYQLYIASRIPLFSFMNTSWESMELPLEADLRIVSVFCVTMESLSYTRLVLVRRRLSLTSGLVAKSFVLSSKYFEYTIACFMKFIHCPQISLS